MPMLSNLIRGLKSLLRSDNVERDLDDELQGFLDESIADKQRRGHSPQQAEHLARVEMGSTNTVKHHIRSVGWETHMENLLQDLRYAIRTLLRSPGFTAVAILSLALGIGANTAIFTLLRQVVMQQLPVRNPQELFAFGIGQSGGILGGVDMGTADLFTYDFARHLQKDPGPFQGIAAYSSFAPMVNVRIPGLASAVQAPGKLVTGNFFQVLQAAPLLGRTIESYDATAPGSNAVAVISYHFWMQSLSANTDAVGKSITVNGLPFTIVGVMPEPFHDLKQGARQNDFWFPVTMASTIMMQPDILHPDHFFLDMVARRNPQNALSADQQWLDRQIRTEVRTASGTNIPPAREQEIEHLTVRLTPADKGLSYLRSRYRDSLLILAVIVGVVLLIACANLANFLLARAIARQREVTTRLALGSSRGRILGQSILEALLLSLTGGALGLGVAFLATRALIAFVMHGVPASILSAHPEASVLAFTFAISVIAGLLFGLAPALQFARSSNATTLAPGARTSASSDGNSARFWPKALITVQVVLALLLLVVAGLFIRTLRNLQSQDLGFERTHLLVAQIQPDIAGYTPERLPALNQRLLETIAAVPGVRSVALADGPPISTSSWRSSFHPSGYTPAPREEVGATLRRVTGQYFETTGNEIIGGRSINPTDTATSMKVAVINQALADKYYPHGNAIGQTLQIDLDTPGAWRIVGIARNSRSLDLRSAPEPLVYLPLFQLTGTEGKGTLNSIAPTVLVRTAGEPSDMTHSLRNAIVSVDPNLPLLQVHTIQEHLGDFTSTETLISRLTLAFAVLAVLLAAIGLYGVMSFNVTRRTNEIGIRMALGASNSGVQWMVLRESLLLLLGGLLLGLPLTLITARLLRSQLYQMSPFDPIVFAAATLGIAAVTIVSAWLPSRRAAAIDPMVALRYE
ncbi:ABC transporter permease [Terriglobus roseus]|uniref:Duplicated orphan permease n=1 Tax=Terriglobus roseus TaxID=392734 RepID=A0A1G7J1U3_9BACT|nr:ABC transporter permease [Terriglobus roseus]SDF18853.1 duplicated orphan permease [Terriglobus roseus]